jgi:hypothetical protein
VALILLASTDYLNNIVIHPSYNELSIISL